MLLTNALLATDGPATPGHVLLEGDRILSCGPDLPAPSGPRLDCGGRLLTPGLIDSHSHAVFAGSRAAEFEARLRWQPGSCRPQRRPDWV